MCFILAIFGKCDLKVAVACLEAMRHRGPDAQRLEVRDNVILGFGRLSIVDPHMSAMQPIAFPSNRDVTILYNGEIYNHKHICGEKRDTSLDGEAISRITDPFEALQMLDGVFATVVINWAKKEVWVARDPAGVRPLFVCDGPEGQIAFASEAKGLPWKATARPFLPNTVMTFRLQDDGSLQSVARSARVYYPSGPFRDVLTSRDVLLYDIYLSVVRAVKKRYAIRDKSVGLCSMLSGGIDSSIVSALLQRECRANGEQLEVWSIGNTTGSTDLPFAKMVADHIDARHSIVYVTMDDLLSIQDEVLISLESYDPTTYRASSYMWWLCREIKRAGRSTIVFSGEGFDEICGGYRYMLKAPTPDAYHHECVRLCSNLYWSDVLRGDRCIMAHHLEGMFPGLDKNVAAVYGKINPNLRRHPRIEKQLLREAFKRHDPDLLPFEVLDRVKEAFSDGGSTVETSWHKIVEAYAAERFPFSEERAAKYTHLTPTTAEELMLREKFHTLHPELPATLLPSLWKPRFVESSHSSAREWETAHDTSPV